MSLKGNLSSVNLTEIFQMLSLSGREGTLFIYEGARKRAICFTKEGVSIRSRERNESNLIGKILVRLGKIDERDLEKAIEERRNSQNLLGDVLAERDACTREDVEHAFRIQSQEDIQELFLNRSDAQFEYVDGYFPESDAPFVTLNVNSLLIEIARRTDEWEYIRRRIRGPREIYHFTGVEGSVDGDVLDECYHARIDALIDGSHSVGDIIEHSYVNKFEVCKLLSAYLDAGVIELVPSDAIRQNARLALRMGDPATAIRNYEYLMSTGDFPLDVMGEAAEAHEADRDYTEAATLLRRLGEEMVRAGDERGAMDALRRVANYPNPEPEALRYLMDLVFQNPRVAAEFQANIVEAGKTLVAHYLKVDHGTDALALLERLVKTFPEEVAFAISLVHIYYEDGNLERATNECEKLAAGFLKRKKQGPAVSLYKKLLVMDPERHDIRERIRKIVSGKRKKTRSTALPRLAIAFAFSLIVGGVAVVYLQERTSGEGAAGGRGLDSTQTTKLFGRAVGVKAAAEEHGGNAMEGYSKLLAMLGDDPLHDQEALVRQVRQAEKRHRLFTDNAERAGQITRTILEQSSGEEVAARARATLASIEDLESKVRAARARWRSAAQKAAERLGEDGVAAYTTGRYLRARDCFRLAQELATKREWRVDVDVDKYLTNIERDFADVQKRIGQAKAREDEGDWVGARRIILDLVEEFSGADLVREVRLPLEILTVPPGATIRVGGDELPQKTPAIVRLSPFEATRVGLARTGFLDASFELGPFGNTTEAADYEHLRTLQKKPAWMVLLHDHVQSTPAVWRESIAVATRNGRWFVLDARNGEEVKSSRLTKVDGVTAGLVCDGETLYIPAIDGKLVRFDARTREYKDSVPNFKGALYATPLLANGVLYVVDHAGWVMAFDTRAGKQIWRVPTQDGVQAAPVLQGGDLVICSTSGAVSVLDARTGEPTAKPYKLRGTILAAPAAVGTDDLVVATSEGTLYGVDRRTGTIHWTQPTGVRVRTTPPVRGRAVFLSPQPGELVAFDVNTGDEIYRYARSTVAARAPVARTNRIFFAEGTTLSAFAPTADGYGLAWTFEAQGRILAGPVVVGGAVYIGDEKGYFYRLDADD